MNPKQARFVEEYLVDLNATQAAIRAGYAAASAEVTGSRLLGNAKIRSAVEAAQAKRSQRTQIVADDVLREIACIAFAKITDVWQWDEYGAGLIPSEEISPQTAAAVAEVSFKTKRFREGTSDVEVTERKVKMHPKLNALVKLGEHLGLFNDLGSDSPRDHAARIRQALREMEEADGVRDAA